MLLACLLLGLQVESARLPYADRYDLAFAEAKARNVPVLLLDFDGWSTARGDTVEAFYEDKEFLAAVEGAVLVLASQEDHGSKQQKVDGIDRAVCATFGGTSCSNHRDILPKAFADFGRDGQLVSPLFAIAAPDHKELGRLEHEEKPPAVTLLLRQAIKRVGAGLPRADYVRLDRGLKEIQRLADLNEFAAAVTVCSELKKIPGTFAPQQELAVAERKLDEAGKKKVQRADELWNAGRHLDALLEMDDAKNSFGKLSSAATAASRMSVWEKSPEAKPLLADLKSDRAARALYQQGVEFDRKGDAPHALQALEKLLKAYPDSRFTDRARGLVSALKGRQ